MSRRIACILTLLSLALSPGPAAVLPRAFAQQRPAPPSDRHEWAQRHSRRHRPSGDPRAEGGDHGPSRPAPATPSAASTSPAASQPTGHGAPDLRGWARKVVAENDKDGDMMLRGDELAGLHGEVARSDLDGDGVITVDEIVKHLSALNAPGSAAASQTKTTSNTHEPERRVVFGQDPHWQSSASPETGPEQAKKITGEGRKSYRFRSPKERLPDGLPSFFSRDANGDGQISMSEYSHRWSDRTVAEFRRYDRNNDGMITPKECLKRK